MLNHVSEPGAWAKGREANVTAGPVSASVDTADLLDIMGSAPVAIRAVPTTIVDLGEDQGAAKAPGPMAVRNAVLHSVHHGREAAIIRARSILLAARAQSTASRSELCPCGLTEDEIADLEVMCSPRKADGAQNSAFGGASAEQ